MSKNKSQVNSEPSILYYPKSNDININFIDLKWKFFEFKEAIKKRVSIEGIIAIISTILPLLFVEKFNTILGIDSNTIRNSYYSLIFIVGLYLCKNIFFTIFYYFINLPLIKKIYVKFYGESFYDKNEIDPEQKTKYILKQCIRNNE